ncbi:MAG: autotransporter-associated beta strand repeat-containing protein [Kiritimatiellia bacterium]|jgi:fibronectin-binding autotransporter adhesin
MKKHIRKKQGRWIFFLIAWAMPTLLLAQDTGWNQTGAGPYNYTNTANWVDGDVNGVWDSTLTLTKAQTVEFDCDAAIPSLAFNYAGGYNLTLQSDGSTNRTLALNGDISAAPVAKSRTITIGSTTADNGLDVDLGGATRNFSATSGQNLVIANDIANGGVSITGEGAVTLSGANTFEDGVILKEGTLKLGNASALGTGAFDIGDTTGSTAVQIDSTVGNLVNTQNNPQNWNQDFAFSGSQNLDLGTGDVTLAGNRTINVASRTLTVGGAIGGDSHSLTKEGTGKLVLNGTNTYSGGTVVNAGSLEFGGGAIPETGSIFVNVAGAINPGSAYPTIQGLLDSGKIDQTSSGTLALSGDSSESIDFSASGYDNLMLGASTASAYTGTLTPFNGVYRLGGGGANLTLAEPNTLTGANSLVVCAPGSDAGSPRIIAPQDFTGDTTVESQSLTLSGSEGALAASDVLVKRGAALNFTRETESDPGTTRVGNVRLEASTLNVYARKSVDATETIGGTLTLAPSPDMGGTPQLYIGNNSKNIHLNIQRVERDGEGILNVTANNASIGTSDFTSGCNITINEGAEAIGTGTDGTTTCPVIPWARSNGRLMTYHPTLGLRLLDRTTEFNSYANGYVGSVATPGENLLINAGTTIEFTNAVNVVNAIESTYGATFRLHVTNGVLHVASGAIFFDANSTGYLNANLDFGNRRGYIVDRAGKQQVLQGSVAGTGGLTLANYSTGNSTYSTGTGITLSSRDNTYQGDTHIHGRVSVNTGNFFPGGSRLGDLHVHGYFQFGHTSASQTINGLNGAGYIYLSNSYNITLTVGDNDANGDYTGRLNRSNGNFHLTKIGAGTQRFGGECTHNGATTVDGGTLIVDGSFTRSAVTVNTDASLKGAGAFGRTGSAITVNNGATLAPGGADGLGTMTVSQGNVVFADGATMEVTAGENGQSALSVAGDVTGACTVPVAVNGTGFGKWKILDAASIEPTFVSATEGVLVTLEADGTQLWAERLNPVTTIVVR